MNGEELRELLRAEMAATQPPPPLAAAAVVRAGRRARSRRRTVWCGVGAVVVVLAAAGIAAPGPLGGERFSLAGPWPQLIPGPLSEDTAEPWPTGPDGRPQQDRTARAGARYDQGVRLLAEIVSVVPAGYTAPENSTNQPAGQSPLRVHQAQFEKRVNGVEVWSYRSSAALAQGDRVGRLLVEVHTAGNQLSTEPCALAQQFGSRQGECQVVTAGVAQVGVVVQPPDDDQFDQWAAYRHPNGVVTFVAQARTLDEDRPGLDTLPFSVSQLAVLAVDDRFHLE